MSRYLQPTSAISAPFLGKTGPITTPFRLQRDRQEAFRTLALTKHFLALNLSCGCTPPPLLDHGPLGQISHLFSVACHQEGDTVNAR